MARRSARRVAPPTAATANQAAAVAAPAAAAVAGVTDRLGAEHLRDRGPRGDCAVDVDRREARDLDRVEVREITATCPGLVVRGTEASVDVEGGLVTPASKK